MGFIFSILKRIIKFLLYTALVIAIILFIPNLPPYTKFTSIEIEPSQPRTGALSPNGDLNNVERLYIDKLSGPEAFQLWNGELYTGLATGELVKISRGGHVTFVTQIGRPCTGIVHEHICGRPLGFVIDDKNKQLYVADAYLGIWRVDLKSYKKQLLVSPQVAIEGRKPMLFNSVALANNGDLYWTDSTSDYQLKDGVFAIISDPAGRLLRYNPAKNESTVLLDDLWFPNGIIMSPDNQFILLAETNQLRVLKHYVDGPKKGLTEVFVSGLPGTPDTIRALPDGSGVLVALYVAFDDEHPLLSKSLASTPLARKAAARILKLLEMPFEFLNSHFPHIIFEQILYTIGHFATISGFGPGLSGLVQLDWNGNIVASYYNTDNSVEHISDAIVYNDKLYLGSPHRQNFIGSVPVPPLLKKAFNVAKPSPSPTKPVPEKQIPKKEKPLEEVKNTPKIEKPVEKKPIQKSNTENQPNSDKVKAVPQKQKEAKSNDIPKDTVKQAVKEETIRTTVKDTEVKSKKEAIPEPTKPMTGTATPAPKVAAKKETIPAPKVVPESKQNVVPESKQNVVPESKQKVVPESKQKIVPESKPKAGTKKETVPEPTVATTSKAEEVPKVEPKKDVPVSTLKSEKPTESKVSGQEKPTPKVDSPKATTTKPEKAKTSKNSKKSQEEEPQIIVQKVVPDEIPITEEIISDTAKPKDESLKVIKKTGPTEIPAP